MKEKLMKNMGYVIVLLDIAIYFILSYVFVDKFQADILAIIVNGALLFIGAITATIAMMKQGILIGRDSEKYKQTLSAHINQKNKIYPKLNKLQGWLDYNYLELLRIGRSTYINSAGYDYSEVFSDDGKKIRTFKIEKPQAFKCVKWYQKLFLPFYKLCYWLFSDEWKVYREKKRLIKTAKKYRITRLTVSDLMNVNAEKDPNNFGITERQYQTREGGASIITRLVFSVLLQSISFGFYGFNLETFLTQMLSVVLILLSAFFSMFNAYSFMVKTHRETIIKKINKLEEFDNVEKFVFDEIEKIKEEEISDDTHTEISVCTKGDMVEEIHGHIDTGQENDLCSD